MSISTHLKEHAILGISPVDLSALVVTGGSIDGTPIGGSVPAAGAFTTLSSSSAANLLSLGLGVSSDVKVTRYAAKQVMISGDGVGATTNAGIIAGYYGVSSYGFIGSSAAAPTSNNYALRFSATQTTLNGETLTSIAANGTSKLDIYSTAGRGPDITAGTATTDVPALSVTRTNNNAAVVKGVKFSFTDTTSAAGFLPFQILGGSDGTTSLLKVSKSGQLDAPSLTLGGGVDYYSDANGPIVKSTSIGYSFSNTTNASTGRDTNISRISAGVIGIGTGAAGSFAGSLKMTGLMLDKTITAPGTTGAQTINKSTGRVNFAAAATSLVVTNSLVDANSIIQCTAATADATGYVTGVVAAAGSFTIYVDAPTAEMAVDFTVTN